MKQTTKQLSNEHLQLQQTQEESLERGFPIDDFDSIEDIEDINGEYNDNNVHHQYLVCSNTNIDINPYEGFRQAYSRPGPFTAIPSICNQRSLR